MLLPETKEREYRFRLALRMVLPIFALILSLVLHSYSSTHNIDSTFFYIEAILILAFSIYFIFFLIYSGFEKKITERVSKVFTREYLEEYLKKEIKKSDDYTLLLISIDNLDEINKRYGINNGDRVLFEVARWIGNYLEEKNINNFPIGHVKGGDFVIGLKGSKSEYKTIMELMCLKAEELQINDVEIQMSGAINDTTLSKDIDYLIENLFELQNKNRDSKLIANIDGEMDPSELESYVINAINRRDLLIMTQDVFEKGLSVIKECFIKLQTKDGNIIHQKSYMKVLDKLGLMYTYDLIVIEKIVNMCSDSDEKKYAISVSPSSIRNPRFISSVMEFFKKNSNAKNKILFLLSENEYYPRSDRFNTTLKTLRDMGILIVIDRLGSIHSSFLYFKDLDIDIVRFDSSFTKEIADNKNRSVIDGFNTMAHLKGIKTWMKMLETEDSFEIAQDIGVDYMQGKYLSPLEKN